MESPWSIPSLNDLVESIWTNLVAAEGDPNHPWRLAVLATASRSSPNARTVVLRAVTRPGFELLAFSDKRTAKVEELERNPRAVWLFYDAKEKVQLRAFTDIRLYSGDTVADTYWHRLPAGSRRNYQTELAPGTPLDQPLAGQILSPGIADRFAVVVGRVTRLDWLWLAPDGHRRAEFHRKGAGWQGHWTVP